MHEEGRLEAYASGTLPENEVRAVEEHLLVCPACRERLAETEAYVRAMRAAAARARAAARRPKPFPWLRPAFALAAAALAVYIGAAAGWRAMRARPAAAEIVLEATRGVNSSTAPAGAPLHLSLDATGLPPLAEYRVEVVDETGRGVLGTSAAPIGGRLPVAAPGGLDPGHYFVRVYGGALLREYALTVTR